MIKDIFVIQDSHTDIGFTNTQGRVLRWYSAYTRQAIEIAETNPDFRWTCETFLQVEQFWRHADEIWRQRFVKLVREGRIGLSASWANFNELPDAELFDSLARRARRFADENKLPLNTAVMADINGCPLSHARALNKAGAQLLLMHVNPWHGCVMGGKRMQSFWWDLGNGRKMLVYYNEAYHFGNELGLFPGAEANATNFNDPLVSFDETILDRRLPEYLHRIEKTDWPHDFLIVTGSGLITDNSPPGEAVVRRIAKWNADPFHRVKIRMITASEIFGIVTAASPDLPTYSGDWTDWWGDGLASDPEGIMLFRKAQRERRWLNTAGKTFPQAAVDFHGLDTALASFAEHTYGHCSSGSTPWNPTAQQLHARKMGYVAEAADTADCLNEEAGQAFGYTAPMAHRPLHFVIINPHDEELIQPVDIEVDAPEVHYHGLDREFVIKDAKTNEVLPHQPAPSLRGIKAVVMASVPARSQRHLYIQKWDAALTESTETAPPPATTPPSILTSDDGQLVWNPSGELVAWKDRTTGRDLVDSPHKAFVLETTRSPAAKTIAAQFHGRAEYGQNRRSKDSQHFTAKPTGIQRLATGPLFESFNIDYEAPGFEFLKAEWTVHRQQSQVDIEIIGHKIGTWDSENVYCPLPFSAGHASQLWIDRGWPMRPWQDQLPGTPTDFYGTQDGIAWCADGFGVAVAMLDSHLIHCGDFDYRPRRLMKDADLPAKPDSVYAWLMTNYWETNFSIELGGFYSFRFRVAWGKHLADPETALKWARQTTTGLRAFRQGQLPTPF